MDQRAFIAPGERVSAGGSHYHVRRWGQRGPLILLECGLTMMSSCWGWIGPELSRFAQVIAYDRAGLGWSEARAGVRDARTIAAELRELLRALDVQQPIILAGHSLGALFNRAFAQLNPCLVSAMIWLDPAHPEQIRRRPTRRRMRNMLIYLEAARLLAATGLPAIELPLSRHLDSLPEPEFRTLRRFLRNPTHLRTSVREARAWETAPESMGDLGKTPILLLSAQKNALPGWNKLQIELAALSTRTHHRTFSEMSHLSTIVRPEHTTQVAAEIRGFIEGLAL